jgi:hypothetical protein
MSIKRTKQRSFSSREADDSSSGFGNKPVVPQKTWPEAMAGKSESDFTPYAMTSRFAKGALIAHSKFGKGVVVGVEGARVEVLFEDGPKKLGHSP